MGRYYSGDIEGKFWFGVQSSHDGEFFGAIEQEPIEISSIPAILEWYARLELGQKIYKAIKNQGYCSFTADL